MNKVQLIQRVAKEARVKKSQASRSVKALVKTIREALRVGDKVSLSGLGTFKVKSRKARKGRNPKTGETIQIPVGRKVSFKPSFSLEETRSLVDGAVGGSRQPRLVRCRLRRPPSLILKFDTINGNMPDFSDRLNRLPPYLFTRITQLKKEAYAKKLDVIDLGMGNPDQPTPAPVVERLCDTVQNHRFHAPLSAGQRNSKVSKNRRRLDGASVSASI